MISTFVNRHIKQCVPDSKEGPVVTHHNVALKLSSLSFVSDTTARILKLVNNEIERLQTMDEAGAKKNSVPAIMVMTVDTMNVVEMHKELINKYGNAAAMEGKYDVRIHKLFARHIKPQEQADQLCRTHPSFKTRQCLNVYVGTPNRLAKLSEMKAFFMDKGDILKMVILDCRLNKKEMSLFEDKESQKDVMQVLAFGKDRWTSSKKDEDKRLKLCLV